MKTQPIGRSSLISSRLAYGCMRILRTWDPTQVTPDREADAKRAVHAAVDAGYTFFDHADIYGRTECERVFGDLLRAQPALRNRMIIATKCGVRRAGDPKPESPHRFDLSREHIVRSCEGSLSRLSIDTIDIYQLHRPDVLMDPAEVAEAFMRLRQQGKVRYFGVSNFTPSFVTTLQAYLSAPLIVNQVPIHLGDLHCFTDGTLDQCLERRITPLAYSPVGGGFLADGGTVPEDHPQHAIRQPLIELLDEVAARYNTSRTVVSLAWLLKHPAGIIPIVGSADPAHIATAAQADDLNLDREDWYRLFVAARGRNLP